jgi:phosphoglycolate phosphatase
MQPVVFDLDGTLIDSLPDIAAAANATLADHDLPALPTQRIGTFVGLGEQVFVDRLIGASALNVTDRPRIMARFITHYKAATGLTRVFPGVRDALDALRAAHVPMGLCTNKPQGPLDAVLTALNLRAYFDVIVAGDTLARRKPAPDPLNHAFDQLGTRGIYVGDNRVDAQTAAAVGVPFVLFTQGIRDEPISAIPHDASFSEFSEFPKLYKQMAG